MTDTATPFSRSSSFAVPVREISLAFGVFVADSIAFSITRSANGIALFWPGCALAACILIRLPRVRWAAAVLGLVLAVCLANLLVAHRPPAIAGAFAALNLLEVALMVGAFRYIWVYPYPDITIGQAATMTAVLGIAVPGLCALMGAMTVFAFRTPSAVAIIQIWSSHTLGACLLGPPLILISTERVNRLIRRVFVTENILTLAICLAGTYFAIRYLRFPFVTISLLLLLASFRLGGFGTSLLSLAVGFLVGDLWILGVRPLGLEHVPVSGTLADLPIVAFLTMTMPPITVGIGNDSRRATALALKISERRFRESMENSPIGMLIADLDGRWMYTNLMLQSMLGYTEDEFRSLPPGGPSAPEEWQTSAARLRSLLTNEVSSYQVERRFRHKDGRWVWAHVAVSLMRDERERPLHLIAQIESLEERRSAEATLTAERERLRVTLHAIADAVVTTDVDLKIQYVNPAAERLLGIPQGAALDRRIGDVIHLVNPDTQRTAASLIVQSIVHAKSVRRERPCLLHRSDGTICYVVDSVSPVLEASGQVTGLVIILQDATNEVDRSRDLQLRAAHDSLTGLLNRAEFEVRLRKSFDRARTLTCPAALVAIDLDRFKAVNDTGGHAVGDEMLKKVATVCRLHVRASDPVARLGGDEFAIILENCSAERVERIGDELLHALNPLVLDHGGISFVVGASIGVVMVNERTAGPEAWLRAADEACYEAKHSGRGRVRFDR